MSHGREANFAYTAVPVCQFERNQMTDARNQPNIFNKKKQQEHL
jgi:hypothetical protein